MKNIRLIWRLTNKNIPSVWYRWIKEIDAFQTAGVFDHKLYQRILNLNRLNTEDFEIFQRESILIGKLKNYIEGNVRVSDAEALDWYNWQYAAVDIDYVMFDPARYQKVNPYCLFASFGTWEILLLNLRLYR